MSKRKAASEKNLASLEGESKKLKRSLEKCGNQKMKTDLAVEEARFLLAKTR